MSLESVEISLQQQFEEVIASEDKLAIKDFLNDQNMNKNNFPNINMNFSAFSRNSLII